MRRFYEAWKDIEVNPVVPTTELQQANNESDAIKGLSILNFQLSSPNSVATQQ